jgi:hypothetical protein
LYGLENISANNGWAIAVLGAGIVFTGLAVLSLVISQIHRILKYFENRGEPQAPSQDEPEAGPTKKPVEIVHHLPGPKELVSIYRPLVEGMDEPFQLALLYEKAAKMDLPHTHISISRLREAGVLDSCGEGAFVWNQELADSLKN